MSNSFGKDILIQAKDPQQAASFYVEHLNFTITEELPHLISLQGPNINLFIERGTPLGPVLEVFVPNVGETKTRLLQQGCTLLKEEPEVPRCYVQDPFGLIYNLAAND